MAYDSNSGQPQMQSVTPMPLNPVAVHNVVHGSAPWPDGESPGVDQTSGVTTDGNDLGTCAPVRDVSL